MAVEISRPGAPAPGAAPAPQDGRPGLVPAAVAGIGAALPKTESQAEVWDEFFAEHYGRSELAEKLWHRCGLEHRHAVIDPRVEDVREWGTEKRMRRFVEEALPLGAQAVDAALEDAGARARGHRSARGRLLHGLRHAGGRHPAGARPRAERLRPAPARGPHGVLRGGPGAGRRRRRRHRAGQGRR